MKQPFKTIMGWDFYCTIKQITAAQDYLSLCKKRDEEHEKKMCICIFGPIWLISLIGSIYYFTKFIFSIY